MEQREKDKRFLRYLLMAAAVVLGVRYFETMLGIVFLVWTIAQPLVLGAVIAFVLNLVMKQVEKIYFPESKRPIVLKTRRTVSIFASMLLILSVMMLIFWLVVPELLRALQLIVEWIPDMIRKCEGVLIEWSKSFPGFEDWVREQLIKLETLNWAEIARRVFNYATNGLSSLVNSTVTLLSLLFGGVVQFVIALIFAIYLLFSKERLAGQGKRILKAYLKEKTVFRITYVLDTANQTFSRFLVGQCLEAVILGALCAAGMWILRFPYAAMVGAFVGATALLPIVGAYIGGAVGAFMILTVNPMQALFFVLFLVVLQQLEGNLIYPKVVGSSIGLPGIWVLAAVTIGGGLGGIVGMLLGVPTVATLYQLLRVDVARRNGEMSVEIRKAPEETAVMSAEK